jgi:hypothetical protein
MGGLIMAKNKEHYDDKKFLKELEKIAEEHNKKIEEIIEMGKTKK